MTRSIVLGQMGVRLFACRLYNHDYLWFSAYEISKVSATAPVIHNYALTYAMGGMSYGIYRGSTPRYEHDLARMAVYATPALAELFSRTRITYNAVNARSLRTDDAPRGINTPDLGWRIYIDPVFESDRGQPGGFGFYLFTLDGSVPKGVVRLGKKGAAARIRWKELESARAVLADDPARPTHPLNPLDIQGEVLTYDPISLPPHLL